MTTTKEKRTLIHEDQTVLKSMQRDVPKIRPTLEKLEDAYSDLEIGPFSNQIFHALIEKRIVPTKSKYFSNIEKEMDAAGLKSKPLRKAGMKEAEKQFQHFMDALGRVLDFKFPRNRNENIPLLKLSDITYYDYGAFELDPKEEEKILEQHCRTYLVGEAQHDLYDKAKKFWDSCADLKNTADNLGFIYHLGNDHGIKSLSSVLFDFKSDTPTIKPNSIHWIVSGQKEWEAEKRRQRERTRKFLQKTSLTEQDLID